MQYIESIMLYCLKQLNGERTIYSIYHLFNGKKSSQTIQDASLFSLKKYFGIFESFTRETFDEIFKRLVDKNWVEACSEQRFLLSVAGEAFLQKKALPAHINGWKYQHTSLVWDRMSLLIQVSSNLAFHETRYIPIQKNKEVHHWLKGCLRDNPLPRDEIGKVIFSELVDCLEEAQDINPDVLIFRLTGYQQIGLTSLQIAKKLDIDPIDYHLEFINILHYIIQRVESDAYRFKMLAALLSNLMESDFLTLSSRKTLVLLNQGFSVEQIANIRNLKLNTIEDHLVEFALNINEFSIDRYVDREVQKKIMDISRENATRQLKIIRNSFKSATYFQIRLVMAKYGDRKWN